MREFIRNTLNRQKLQQLCVNTALGNFVAYAVGSFVMVLTTYIQSSAGRSRTYSEFCREKRWSYIDCPSGSNGLWPFSSDISSWSLCGTSSGTISTCSEAMAQSEISPVTIVNSQPLPGEWDSSAFFTNGDQSGYLQQAQSGTGRKISKYGFS